MTIWLIEKLENEDLFQLEIGPEEAHVLLGLNTDNYRTTTPSHVAFLDGEMAAHWHGKTVIRLIRRRGELVLADGQHRLQAIVRGNHQIEVIFIVEDDEEVADVLDQNLTRTLATILKRHGEKNCSPLAAGLRWGIVADEARVPSGRTSPSEALALLEKNPGYRESVTVVKQTLSKPLGVHAGPAVWMHHETSMRAPDWAEYFWEHLATGENLEKGDPILVLRELLIKDHAATARMSNERMCARMIKGWNAYVRGDKISLLRWYSSGPYKEPFPKLIMPNND